MEYIPYRKDEVAPGHRFYEYLPQQGYAVARVDIRGSGASPGTTRDEYLLQEQLDGVDAVEWFGGQAMVHRAREHDGHLVRRLHELADREPRARASDEHHPDVLHRRPLHRRLPFPRRSDAQVLRRHVVRQHDGRLECAAALSGVVGRLGGGVAGAPRRQRAVPARVVPPPGRLRLLGQRLGRARGRERALPRVPDRRLARRLSQPAAAAVLTAAVPEEGAGRPVGSPPARRRGARAAHRPPARGRALARPLVRRRARTA